MSITYISCCQALNKALISYKALCTNEYFLKSFIPKVNSMKTNDMTPNVYICSNNMYYFNMYKHAHNAYTVSVTYR